MGTIHFALNLVATYLLVVGIQLLDRRYLMRAEVRERAWNRASWGAAVYGLAWLSFLGWGWVTRFRFDPFLAKLLPGLSAAHVTLRGLFGLLTGVAEIVVFLLMLTGFEYVLTELLGLPSFGGMRG